MGKIVTTSIRIDEDVWLKAKAKAVNHKMTLTDLLTDALEEKLSSMK